MTRFVATCARGVETVVAAELGLLGAAATEERRGAVAFDGPLEVAYRACLWSRAASRVLLPLDTFPVADAETLYAAVRAIDWSAHLRPDDTLAVLSAGRSPAVTHGRFAALKTKDAIVDRLRDEHGRRPSVDTESPDVRVHLHLAGEEATVSVDLSGEPLHRRGYRPRRAAAPLKETLAAAILQLAGWPELARQGAPLVDPMCGSGTLLVEAALMAGDVAPGLLRGRHGLEGWAGHDPTLWSRLLEEARHRRDAGRGAHAAIHGFDADAEALDLARASAQRAGVAEALALERRALSECEAPRGRDETPRGLLVTNPPYGERLSDAGELIPLYQTLGDVLRRRFGGWTAHILTGNLQLAKRIGLKAAERHTLFNGPIECRLLEYPIRDDPVRSDDGPAWRRPSREAEMFRNRLRKNLRRLGRWARREGVTCWRTYDADIPEYNVAVDLYEDAAHVQEYERPPKIAAETAAQHLQDVLLVVPEVLDLSPDAVFLKVRRRGAQPQADGSSEDERIVREGGHRFAVSLRGRLDTGLYLDQRLVRREIARLAPGRRFLNLFAHTCTATVYAAAAGASGSVSVDLSNTYLDWGRRNLALNDLPLEPHELVRADCVRWLASARDRFGLVYLAPPIHSRSKGMQGELDLRRDVDSLVGAAAELLSPDGILLYTTHATDAEPGRAVRDRYRVEEISRQTVPPDFTRHPHRAWRITRH